MKGTAVHLVAGARSPHQHPPSIGSDDRIDLTIHGTTKSVTLDVDGPTPETKDPWGNTRRGLSATTTINRQEFGLKWNNHLGTGEAVVGDMVKIQLDVELVKKK